MSSGTTFRLDVVFDQNFMNKILEFRNYVTQRQLHPRYLPHISLLTFSPYPIGQIDAIMGSVLQTQKRFDVAFFPAKTSESLCLFTENATLLGLQLRLHHAFSVNDDNTEKYLLWPLVLVNQIEQIHTQQLLELHLSELRCSSMVEALRLVTVESQYRHLRELRTYHLPSVANDHHLLPLTMPSRIELQLHVVFDQYFMNKILEFWNSVTQCQFPEYLPHISLLAFSQQSIEQIDAIMGSVLQTQKRFDVAFFPTQILDSLCLGIHNAAKLEELQLRLHRAFLANDENTQTTVSCWPLVLVEEVELIHLQQLLEVRYSSMVEALRLVRVDSQSIMYLQELKTYPLPSDEHEPFRIAQEIPLLRVSSTSKGCCCKKSKCLKKYCHCFTKGSYCTPGICSCLGCQNSIEHKEIVNKAQNDEHTHPLLLRKGCICLKSNCLKKYCQCFKDKLPCSSECRCKGCKNGN